MRKAIIAAFTAISCISIGSPAFADEWPVPNATDRFPPRQVNTNPSSVLTPLDLEFWNRQSRRMRVLSPFGNQNKIVCTFNGKDVQVDCWQADNAGNPHKLLEKYVFNDRAVWLPYYVYPGYLGSS